MSDTPTGLETESSTGASPLPASVRYVKNGAGGAWWPASKARGQIHAGWADIPHALLLSGDRPAIRQTFGSKIGATQDFNALATLLDAPSQHLWVTFQDGCLWWCTMRDGIAGIRQGNDQSVGHFWLACERPWSNRSLGGRVLAISNLPGAVATVAGFKGTICEPKAWQAILRIVQDQADPDVTAAEAARRDYELAMERLVQRLGWQDFEQLVDLTLLKTGWVRRSSLGKTQEGIDLEVENPSIGETAFVQVKSAAGQAVLDDFVARFSARRDVYDRMIFAVHSPTGTLASPIHLPVQVWTGPIIAKLAVRLGLGDWIARAIA